MEDGERLGVVLFGKKSSQQQQTQDLCENVKPARPKAQGEHVGFRNDEVPQKSVRTKRQRNAVECVVDGHFILFAFQLEPMPNDHRQGELKLTVAKKTIATFIFH